MDLQTTETDRIKAGVWLDIVIERARQDRIHGTNNTLTAPELICLIGEEFGEAAQAANDLRHTPYQTAHYREELIHLAAMTVKAVELLDSKGKNIG